jgi:transcriptional regulator with XRE-family HTH domain
MNTYCLPVQGANLIVPAVKTEKFKGITAKEAGALLRQKRGVRTQAQLASAIGIDPQYLSDYERGKVDWRRSDYRGLLIRHLQISISELESVGFEDDDFIWQQVATSPTLTPEPESFPTLREVYQSGLWRNGDVFSAKWTNKDGYIVLVSDREVPWLSAESPLWYETIAVDPTKKHGRLQIGVYAIKNEPIVLLSTAPIEGRQGFAYRHTADVDMPKVMHVAAADLEYMGRMVGGSLVSPSDAG